MNIEQMKQVVENAPDGATHIGVYGIQHFEYWKVKSILDDEEYYCFKQDKWVEQEYWYGQHLLSDLKTILDQAREIERLRCQSEPKRWFTYCCDDGYQEHESEESAKKYADRLVRGWLDDCWGEEVADVRMGIVTHQATEGERTYPQGEIDEEGLDETGEYFEPEWGYKVNWSIEPLPQPPKEKDDE